MESKQNFCTLFNSFFLSRGLALHESLMNQKINFELYIFCFDEFTYSYLLNKKLPNVTAVSLETFLQKFPELAQVKPSRSVAEFCWTSTSFTIQYCLEQFSLSSCTYLDADMYFYDDPGLVIKEKGDNSVIITPHYYFPEYDQSGRSGIYCVQFMYFANTLEGLEVLRWWSKACIQWCYARVEDGKFGDQKYLDFWSYYFKGVHINRHQGAGMAPWNAIQYGVFSEKENKYRLVVKETQEEFPLVFFHFHGLRLFNNAVVLTDNSYKLPKLVESKIYADYIERVLKFEQEIESEFPGKGSMSQAYEFPTFKRYLRIYYDSIKDAIKMVFAEIKGRTLKVTKRNRIKLK